jgi:LysR family glycine cleavage system transcriptional activator
MHPENTRPAHDLPPLELLRSFEVAARTLSFTQAAAELH